VPLDAFRPVRRTPLSVQVSRQLRDAIVSGDLGLGTELPSEKVLTERFGVSRSTVREALRILQAQGLLSGGDTVSTARPRVSDELTLGAAADALENVLRLGQVPLADLLQLRLLLEDEALRTAPATGADLEDARREVELMRDPTLSVAAFHDADVRFHLALSRAGGNAAVPLVMGVLRHAVAAHLLAFLQAADDVAPVLRRLTAEHAGILGAVERGDADRARALMRRHVGRFYAAPRPARG
jgi:GntR family transcriptional regulator, transcriptional repressor for pyruvate dehydrogenase complex